MGLFNEDQVKRLEKFGVKAEVNKDYTPEERENFRIKVFEHIFSGSTKNDDIRNAQRDNSDIINLL